MSIRLDRLLQMEAITKRFSGNTVLDRVNLSLNSGEILALLGANGAGKSTLMKILTGVHTQDEGSVRILDEKVTIKKPLHALNYGIRFVPQELSVLPDLSVGENIFQGQLPLKSSLLSIVDFGRIYKQSSELLQRLGVDYLSPKALIRNLSVSEQRIVEIARGLARKARILILDEPTASLAESERKKLFDILRRLKKQKIGIIFISHYLDEVFELSDRIIVIRDGCNSGDFITSKTDHNEVLSAMLGKETGRLYPPFAEKIGSEVLSLQNVSNKGLLKNISLNLKKGEIHGVFGLLGSGVEELGKVLFGAIASQGVFSWDGKPYYPSTDGAIKAGMGYVSADRKSEGLILTMTVRENLTLPFLTKYKQILGLNVDMEKEVSAKRIGNLHIKTTGGEQKIDNLSGGNQQKVCIGRWLENDLKMLVLEEPTRGVDLGARKDIYEELRLLTNQGLSILIISSDSSEIAGLCDRTTVLFNGKNIKEFGATTDSYALTKVASGL